MQDIRLPFTSDRERRTSDDVLRDQLSYIAKRALAGNRGRGWDYEVGPISALDRYVKETQSTYYTMSSHIRFYRRVDVDLDRLKRQSTDIIEWASATGHSARFGKRPWVAEVSKAIELDMDVTGPDDTDDDVSTPERERDEIIPLREVGIIKPGSFYKHLYGLDAQISVLLSSLQAAADSDMRNRFHVLLNGVPGCGKTEILIATAHLLDRLGVFYTVMDATSTTEAGVRKEFLDETKPVPEVIIIEEVEKAPDNAQRWLLGVMDPRAEISQTNARRVASRKVPALVLSTANDMNQLERMMYGALRSRYQLEIYCPRPSRGVLAMILQREVGKVEGDVKWIEPTLTFMYDENGVTDPRKIIPVCLCGKEKLLTGDYQRDLKKTMKLDAGTATPPTTITPVPSVDTAALAALFTQTEGNPS